MISISMRKSLILIVAAIAAVIGGVWLNGGDNLATSSVSPDGRFQLDLYYGKRWQRAFYGYWYIYPGFAKMTGRGESRSRDTSPVFDLSSSETFWSPEGVLISSQAEFLYASNRWIKPGSARHFVERGK